MLVHKRRELILDRLAKRPRWSMTGLQRALRVSRSTLRRDLLELEESGDVVRVHGAVVHRDYLRTEPSVDRRSRQATSAKRAIAATAAALTPPGAVVYLDAGSTCLEVGRLLLLRKDVRIFTHSIRLLMESDRSETPITCIGGEYRRISQALVGGLALEWLRHLSCDIAFLGASGLSESAGASTTELNEAAVKQAILGLSRRSILVADFEKWNAPAAMTYAPWDRFEQWITDRLPTRAAIKALAHGGVTVKHATKAAAYES